uniref:Odorant receptor, family H, subfamily 137, member 8 n=1 Tax=Danio rerio TaxID=7955 RepID=A0A1L1QZJ8_DANRE|nr:olfactory receptor 6C74 [Danio rerio]|eukprot:XP_001923221.1 olfactory receptor 6C74 [Danio rerio]
MNSTMLEYNAQDRFRDALVRNVIVVIFGITINSINGVFVFTFFRSSVFYKDPRYILYIHLVINDMLMVFVSVSLSVMAYAWQNVPFPFCVILLIIASKTHKNSLLTLAGMSIERYIAICKPLHHYQICTVRRTYILISLIWSVGVLPGLADFIVLLLVDPSIFTKTTVCTTAKLYYTPYHEELSKYMTGIYTCVVCLILIYTYCRVLITARKASTDKSSAKKAQSTILLHGAQLLLCMLSYITGSIEVMYAQLLPADRSKLLFCNYLLTNLLPRLLTPMIYGVRDKVFYSHMKGIVACKLVIVKVESTKG